MYNVADKINPEELIDFKTHKSTLYGMTNIFSFTYGGKHYYITDDYSLMDDPRFIKDVLQGVCPNLKGNPMTNPNPQSDGAKYASGLNGTEYYLWEAPI